MQVDPVKPTLKAPGTKGLKLKYGKPLTNFGFKFNLRRHIQEDADAASYDGGFDELEVEDGLPVSNEAASPRSAVSAEWSAGLADLSDEEDDADAGPGQGLTLVHFSAQPEPSLTQNTPCTPRNTL